MMGHSMISLCFKFNLHAAVRLVPSAPCGRWDHRSWSPVWNQ